MSIVLLICVIAALVLAGIWTLVPNARKETIGVAVILLAIVELVARLA